MKTYEIIEGLKQNYNEYTKEDLVVWAKLFERQMDVLSFLACKEYLEGIKTIQFEKNKIPNFNEINNILKNTTSWEIVVVPGIIKEADFFKLLSKKKFPATTWLRKMNELDYLSEPDMFHDVFGHVPLLTNQVFCDFFYSIGKLGLKYVNNPKIIAMLGRMYWFTVEFGLIKNDNSKKIYGAGIISSYSETKLSLSDVPRHIPFDVELIMNTSFENDKMQNMYFVIESFDELYDSIKIMESVISKEVSLQEVV